MLSDEKSAPARNLTWLTRLSSGPCTDSYPGFRQFRVTAKGIVAGS